MAVTVENVIDPAKSAQYYGASQGHRLVVVELVLRNTGTTLYNDAPAAQLIDRTDRRYAEVIRNTPACPYTGEGLRIAPGGRTAVCVIFDIGKQRRPTVFRFALNHSGLAERAGEWQLSK